MINEEVRDIIEATHQTLFTAPTNITKLHNIVRQNRN